MAKDVNGVQLEVGDRVRCVKMLRHYQDKLEVGEVYTVSNYILPSANHIAVENKPNYFGGLCFEKIDERQAAPTQNRLDELIGVANAGLEAMAEIFTEHVEEVEISPIWGEGQFQELSPGFHATYIEDGVREIRKRPTPVKPKFEDYTIKSKDWRVELGSAGSSVKIGCKWFKMKALRGCLKGLLENGSYLLMIGDIELTASKEGVKWNGNTLPWADAEELYAKIKEL